MDSNVTANPRFESAFKFFCSENYPIFLEELRKTGNEVSSSELARILSESWALLSDFERREYLYRKTREEMRCNTDAITPYDALKTEEALLLDQMAANSSLMGTAPIDINAGWSQAVQQEQLMSYQLAMEDVYRARALEEQAREDMAKYVAASINPHDYGQSRPPFQSSNLSDMGYNATWAGKVLDQPVHLMQRPMDPNLGKDGKPCSGLKTDPIDLVGQSRSSHAQKDGQDRKVGQDSLSQHKAEVQRILKANTDAIASAAASSNHSIRDIPQVSHHDRMISVSNSGKYTQEMTDTKSRAATRETWVAERKARESQMRAFRVQKCDPPAKQGTSRTEEKKKGSIPTAKAPAVEYIDLTDDKVEPQSLQTYKSTVPAKPKLVNHLDTVRTAKQPATTRNKLPPAPEDITLTKDSETWCATARATQEMLIAKNLVKRNLTHRGWEGTSADQWRAQVHEKRRQLVRDGIVLPKVEGAPKRDRSKGKKKQ